MTGRPWTPGPWAATEHSWSDAGVYSTREEVRIAGLSIRSEAEDEPERVVENMNKQMVANAHLMAAAPEMAEALIVFVEANKKQLAHTPADIALAVVALEKAGWKP